jgi:hypothetical protein
MAFSVTYMEEAGVVEMVLRGAVTPADVDAAMTEAGTVGAENLSNRFLIDSRDMPAGGTAFDVLALAELLASLPPGVIEREAVLLSDDAAAADQMEFFETACRNRGLDVRVFRDRDLALGWLTS